MFANVCKFAIEILNTCKDIGGMVNHIAYVPNVTHICIEGGGTCYTVSGIVGVGVSRYSVCLDVTGGVCVWMYLKWL